MTAVVLLFLGLVLLPSSIFYRIVDNFISYERSFPEYGPYLFGRLSRLFATQPKGIRIAIIGGSTTRESLASESALEGELAELTGIQTEVIDLATMAQTLPGSLAVAEQAVCNGGARLVLLGVNLGRLGAVQKSNAVATIGYPRLSSKMIVGEDRWIRRVGADLKGAIAFRGEVIRQAYFVATGRRSFVLKRQLWGRHRYLGKKASDPNRLKEAVAHHTERGRITAETFTLLSEIEQAITACGGRLVYFVNPINPRLWNDKQYAPYLQAHADMLTMLEARDQSAVVDLSRLAWLTESDFQDWGHLKKKQAIERATEEMAHSLAPLLERYAYAWGRDDPKIR
jgi:hypothetical protein